MAIYSDAPWVVVADGQSLTTVPLDGQAWPYQLGPRLGCPVVHIGRGGTTYAQRTTLDRADRVIEGAERPVLYISDGGTSDLIAGMTISEYQSTVFVYLDDRRAAGATATVLFTTPPSSLLDPGPDAVRLAANADMLADPGSWGADLVVDVASIPELQDTGDTDYYYDGTHYTQAAADLVTDLAVRALGRLVPPKGE